MQDTTPDKAANLAERREQVRSLLGRLISERASERAEEREDDLAALRGEAAELAERFREAGEERIANQVRILARSRPYRGRRQEWNDLDHALLSAAVFLLMEREDLSARGACERLADQTIDRTWLLVFDKVVAARHRPTAHALYQQFRLWLQSRGSSISELNSLRRGRHFPVQAFPPHLAAAAADIKWWLEWLIQVTPTLMGPQATGGRSLW